jgi:hypothetical protein
MDSVVWCVSQLSGIKTQSPSSLVFSSQSVGTVESVTSPITQEKQTPYPSLFAVPVCPVKCQHQHGSLQGLFSYRRPSLTGSNPSTSPCPLHFDSNTGYSARLPPGMGRGIRFGPCCCAEQVSIAGTAKDIKAARDCLPFKLLLRLFVPGTGLAVCRGRHVAGSPGSGHVKRAVSVAELERSDFGRSRTDVGICDIRGTRLCARTIWRLDAQSTSGEPLNEPLRNVNTT